MTYGSSAKAALCLFAALLPGACAGARQPVPVNAAAMAGLAAAPTHTAMDAAFMRGMIGHHSQAILMAKMVPARTSREDLNILAARIIVSQSDEIDIMKQWLQERGEPLPMSMMMEGMEMAGHEHHHADNEMPMEGMLSAEELAQLEAASGVEFERLFMAGMIKHHQGAITAVQQLFATPGSGEETDVYKFAADISADQEAEVSRMRRMLDALPAGPGQP